MTPGIQRMASGLKTLIEATTGKKVARIVVHYTDKTQERVPTSDGPEPERRPTREDREKAREERRARRRGGENA